MWMVFAARLRSERAVATFKWAAWEARCGVFPEAVRFGCRTRAANAGSRPPGGRSSVHQAMAPVHATARGNIRIDRVAGPVFASTAGGLIEVQQADGTVTAESSGGAIQVNAANGVQCDSAGGAIRLRNVVGPLHASTNAGSILAELLTGHRIQDSVLSTHAGDITVLIPSNFAVTVVAMNGSSGSHRPDRIGFSGDSCSNGQPAWRRSRSRRGGAERRRAGFAHQRCWWHDLLAEAEVELR